MCSVFGCVVLLLGNQGVEFEVTGQSVVSVRNLCAQSSCPLGSCIFGLSGFLLSALEGSLFIFMLTIKTVVSLFAH